MERRSGLKLFIADNGVVKEVFDHNVNGTEETDKHTVIYEFVPGKEKEKTIEFLYDLVDDLALPTGSKFEEEVVTIGIDTGKSYVETDEYLNQRITELEEELDRLIELRASKEDNE